LNEKVIAALPAPAKGNNVHYFTDAVLGGVTAPSGFGVCVTEAGVEPFVLGYRHGGVKRCMVIGHRPSGQPCWPSWRPGNCAAASTTSDDPLGARRQEKAAQETLFKNICAE
jgi:hypothetical protein